MGLSALWLLPLTLFAGVIGYLGLVFVGFVGEGLGVGTSHRDVASALGVPCAALMLAAAGGLGTARLTSRTASRVAPARLPPWALGLAAAAVGGALGLAAFRIALSAAAHLMAA
jgi:hypothetical protein